MFLDTRTFGVRQQGCRFFVFSPKISANHPVACISTRSGRQVPTVMLTPKYFRMRTSKRSRKCSFQKTYSKSNSFRIRTYKKVGGTCRAWPPTPLYWRILRVWVATLCFGGRSGACPDSHRELRQKDFIFRAALAAEELTLVMSHRLFSTPMHAGSFGHDARLIAPPTGLE